MYLSVAAEDREIVSFVWLQTGEHGAVLAKVPRRVRVGVLWLRSLLEMITVSPIFECGIQFTVGDPEDRGRCIGRGLYNRTGKKPCVSVRRALAKSSERKCEQDYGQPFHDRAPDVR